MILCCGEALIDMLPRRTAEGAPAFAPHLGGSVFNTAVALARLGAPAGFVSGLSRDLFGRRLQDALTAESVAHDLAVVSERPTTLAFVELAEGQARYTFYDENTAGRMLTEADLPELPARVSALFFGGISLATEPCGTAFETLMARHADTHPVMLDLNIRPDFAADPAAYRARLFRMAARADIVKASEDDLAWLAGPGTAEEQAGALRAAGARIVALTAGDGPVTAYSGADTLTVPARAVTVADTVGAGDTFNAGLLAALLGRQALTKPALAAAPAETLAEALDYGVAAAAVTVSRTGADPPYARELA